MIKTKHLITLYFAGLAVALFVPGFGAIAIGEHRFCDCPGVAEFTVVWRKDEDRWRVTRVLSYGHRPAR